MNVVTRFAKHTIIGATWLSFLKTPTPYWDRHPPRVPPPFPHRYHSLARLQLPRHPHHLRPHYPAARLVRNAPLGWLGTVHGSFVRNTVALLVDVLFMLESMIQSSNDWWKLVHGSRLKRLSLKGIYQTRSSVQFRRLLSLSWCLLVLDSDLLSDQPLCAHLLRCRNGPPAHVPNAPSHPLHTPRGPCLP